MKRLVGIAGAAILLVSCSPTTRFAVSLDIWSFLAEDQRSSDFVVPDSTGVTAFFLPGIQIDEVGAGADEIMRRGLEVAIPVVPPESGFSGVLAVGATLRNVTGPGTVAPWNVELVVASAESEDIYVSGPVAGAAAGPALAPGELSDVSLEIRIDSDDPVYPILESGLARVGVRVSLNPSIGGAVNAELQITEMKIDLSFRPYSLFRLW